MVPVNEIVVQKDLRRENIERLIAFSVFGKCDLVL
jgi:hypothetical protein